jgi:hypothetical protein
MTTSTGDARGPWARMGGFALGLVAVFAVALGLGRAVGPFDVAAGGGHADGADHADAPGDHADAPTDHADAPTDHAGAPTGHADAPGGHAGADVGPPAGLQVSQDGYRLEPLTSTLTPGARAEFAFRVLGADGAPVTRYTPTHEKDLHLIVVRRDLSGFQHLHPVLGGDGVWRTPLSVAAAGQYRVFADFRPADRGEALTLGTDVPAPGRYEPTALPAVSRTATVDGYTVELTGDLTPGTASRLGLRISRAGRPVTDLQPYLGAYGHLVTLRAGDLAYLHTHPDGAPGDGRTPAGPEVVFYAEVPGAGTYRLYLDFRHDGVVRTAEFTAATAGVGHP